VKILNNLADNQIVISGEAEAERLILDFCFADEATPVLLDGVSFGYALKSGKQAVSDSSYPPAGMSYVSTDIELVTSADIKLVPETDYTLNVWMQKSEKISASINFTTGRPESFFASWTWNSDLKIWEPPVPMPTDGDYIWNEAAQSWDEVSEN